MKSFISAAAIAAIVLPVSSTSTLPPATKLASHWSYAGCYKDSTFRRTLSSISTHNVGGNTGSTCVNFCASKGYSFAGTEHSGQCWCGSALNEQLRTHGSGCHMPCSGDARQVCGGHLRLTVYRKTAAVDPPVTNIISNPDFEAGTTPWEAATHPTYSQGALVTDGSIVTKYAQNGSRAYQISESVTGASGDRSACVQQTFFHPHTASYQLSFYYGRQSNPVAGSTTSSDKIDLTLYVDGNQIVVLPVCNPSLNECSVKLPSTDGHSSGGYNSFTGTLAAPEGDHTVKLCAVYSSPAKAGISDFFLVDNFDAHQVST